MSIEHINKSRQRLLEAIVFFSQAKKIKNPSKMMMYKLLAEMDFRHFEETGLPVTNLEYEAFPKGPVPKVLNTEITSGKELIIPKDFEDALRIENTEFENEFGEKVAGFKWIAKRKPNTKIFSPRQLRIMDEVAFIYKKSTATEASKASHEPNKPWTITVKTKELGAVIDMVETINVTNGLDKDTITEMLVERKALIYNYGG